MRWLILALVAGVLASPVLAQETDEEKPPDAKKILSDFSFDYDPRELYPRFTRPEGLKLFGPVEIGSFHVFPSRVPGPYGSPPMRIWGNGWGTSLWRYPVTGWPAM